MGIIPKVKCRGCDRSYSALQSKCPYCGAMRSKGGKFSVPESGDPRWRLAIGVILLVAIVGSVIALVTINSKGAGNGTTAASPSPSVVVSASPSADAAASDAQVSDASASPEVSDATVSDPNASPAASDPAASDPNVSASPSISSSIDSLSISWKFYTSGAAKEMTIGVGEEVALNAVIYPTSATDVEVTWTSENPSVCSVDEDGAITGVGTGQTNIVATCDGRTDSLNVRVK